MNSAREQLNYLMKEGEPFSPAVFKKSTMALPLNLRYLKCSGIFTSLAIAVSSLAA